MADGRQEYKGFTITVDRVGTKGEWAGLATSSDAESPIGTGRVGGKGAKAECLRLLKAEIDRREKHEESGRP